MIAVSQGAIPQQIYCRHCGVVIRRDQQICPHCGVRNEFARPATAEQGRAAVAGHVQAGNPQAAGAVAGQHAGGEGQRTHASGSPTFGKSHDLPTTAQLWEGAKFGIGAYVVGLLTTTFLLLTNAMNLLNNLQSAITQLPAVAVAVGGGAVLETPFMAVVKFFVWVFYGSQFVGVTAQASASAPGRQLSRSTGNNVVDALGQAGVLDPFLFHLVPIGLLVAFGYRAARSKGYDEVYEKAAAGASIAVGYVPLGLLGATFASIGFSAGRGPAAAGASVGLQVGGALVVFGLFAVVFGAIGGTLRWAFE